MANNTTSSSAASLTGPRSYPRSLALAILALATPGLFACASDNRAAPQAAPSTASAEQQPEPSVTVAELSAEADAHYERGVQAQEDGDRDAASVHFDEAVRVFMEADVPEGQEEEFRLAFNDLVSRVHTQETEAMEISVDPEATELAQQEIPVLSPGEIEMLRARLADTLPALPRFTVPMPADHPDVLAALEYLTTDRKEVIQEGLARATRYTPMIREVFAEAGVPQELAWIPLIESLFKPVVRSRASAVGLWQLMAPTARLYGLRVDSFVDERRDPIKATYAIAQFISDYYKEFGDWHLAIAAYNGGKGRIARALERTGTNDFWSLAETRALPRETREFVPKILSAILIGTEPHAYGLEFETLPPYEYDVVSIDSMTDLEVIAEAADTSLDTIRELNPALLRRTTPNVDHFSVRVPRGHGDAFRTAFAAIPVSERLRVAEHRVARGETLSHIADLYGVSWREIADFNSIRDPRRVRVGTDILIPVSSAVSSAARVARADLVQGSGLQRGDRTVHTVRSGESLWEIARAYGTTVSAVKAWNGLSSDRIYRGQRLDVYYRTTSPTPLAVADAAAPDGPTVHAEVEDLGGDLPATANYRVSRGDTLIAIARRHGVQVADLKRWNGLRSDRIYPGNILVIRGGSGASLVETSYTIRRGDTLTTIARRYGVSVRDICDWNDISPRTTLYPGRNLTIRSRVSEAAR